MKAKEISDDAKKRAREYIKKLGSPLGAYTSNSKGYDYAREKIAHYISERDGVKSDAANIYLTNGASEGVRTAFNMLIRNAKDGILVPTPQYPLYSALITLQGGYRVPYYLDEEKDWALDLKSVNEEIAKAKRDGVTIRGIVAINPGNPTGGVLSESNIRDIIEVCYENGILIMADEVY